MIFRKSVTAPIFDAGSNIIYNFQVPNPGNDTVDLNLTGNLSFVSKGYVSGLSITATNGDTLACITFIISGTYKNNIISEMLIGPVGNGVVFTDNLYDTITNIKAFINGPGFDGGNNARISSGNNIAVVLDDCNSNSSLTHPNYTYHVSICSPSANAPWDENSVLIYGVCLQSPSILRNSLLQYDERPGNYIPLPSHVGITQLDLNDGYVVETNYPYSSVIVYIKNELITEPTFIEITQS